MDSRYHGGLESDERIEMLCPLLRTEIEALLKFADKDNSGTITFGV